MVADFAKSTLCRRKKNKDSYSRVSLYEHDNYQNNHLDRP